MMRHHFTLAIAWARRDRLPSHLACWRQASASDHASPPGVPIGLVVALVWAQQPADGVRPALQLGRVRAVRPALTRARAALALATAVRWVVPAVARCHAVAPGHATRPWVLPGFVVAVC